MDTRKNIVDLEAFREMLHISPRVLGQSFAELPFKEEILEFLRFLGHSAQIKTLTDGLYHRRNVDYAFLIWEDFVYQVEHKNQKKSNEMYYPRFTKVIIHHFMTKKPSIPRRNKVNWNTKAYKEYYACATRKAAPKPKVSARRKRGKQPARATSPTEPSEVKRIEAEQLKIILKRSRQETHISQHGGFSTDEGTASKPGVPDVPSDDLDEEISWNSSDEEDVNDQTKGRDDNEGEKSDESDDDDDD
nr:hypothetical protein [Tanacetum cinerariifolium]